MPIFAPHHPKPTLDEIICAHSRLAVSGLAYSAHIDGLSESPDPARDSHLSDKIAELAGAVLELFENVVVDVEDLVATLVQYTTSVVTARPLIHCDELIDDLCTTMSNGMTTGHSAIDHLLAETYRRL